MLTIRLFATLKESAGKNAITTEMPLPATVADLLDHLATEFPELVPALSYCLVAVNRAFADTETIIQPEDEIALFPPVSGGNGNYPHPTYFAVTEDKLDIYAIHNQLQQADVGAIVTFSGLVRGQTEREGMPAITTSLHYEAYEEMAVERMAQIAFEIWARWPTVKGVAIVQRIGRLAIGENTTFVACASGHRDQGVFEAARYGIDRLKEIVPIWKQEVGPSESKWIEGKYQPAKVDNMV